MYKPHQEKKGYNMIRRMNKKDTCVLVMDALDKSSGRLCRVSVLGVYKRKGQCNVEQMVMQAAVSGSGCWGDWKMLTGTWLQLFLILLVVVMAVVIIELILGTALELRQQLIQPLPVLRVLGKLAVLARENVL
jgi:hypothetical protein